MQNKVQNKFSIPKVKIFRTAIIFSGFLLILDAKTMTLLAEVTAPQLKPLGLHNKYVIRAISFSHDKNKSLKNARTWNGCHNNIEHFKSQNYRDRRKLCSVFAGFTTQKVDQ